MKFKSLMLSMVVILLAAFAGAQCDETSMPVSPNAGYATTPYSANYFSATFNGPVTFQDAGRSTDNESSNWSYSSHTNDVYQIILVRKVDHDIPNDMTSAEFYRNDDQEAGEQTGSRSSGNWCGHPYTYSYHEFEKDGVLLKERTRYIIVNSRTVIFISQYAKADYNDRDQWLDFEYSLRIK